MCGVSLAVTLFLHHALYLVVLVLPVTPVKNTFLVLSKQARMTPQPPLGYPIKKIFATAHPAVVAKESIT
jgi:hypothetical protein